MINKLSNHLDQALCGQLTEKQKALLLKDSVYFGEAYPLKAELKARDLLETYKLELNPVRFHENWIKMYSVGSSSRLCYLHFRNDPQVQFEYQLGICEKVYAHYDAFDPKNHI